MATTIEISSKTFTRLQAHAIPLVDDIESVINRLIDEYEGINGAPAVKSNNGEQRSVRQFNPLAPPDLTHTKVLSVELNGKPLDGRTNWGNLLVAAIREAKAKAKSINEFKKLIVINYVDRQKEHEGYKFYPDLGISVQGQDANYSWKGACHIAQHLGLALNVSFVWREKAGAAYPSVTGQFSIPCRRS